MLSFYVWKKKNMYNLKVHGDISAQNWNRKLLKSKLRYDKYLLVGVKGNSTSQSSI